MIDLTNLIARVEAATGPDRGLDADILCAVRPEWKWDRSTQQPTGWVSMASGSGISCPAPHFTASVDDAMTMLDPDHWWCMGKGRTRPDEPIYGIVIFNADLDRQVPVAEGEHPTSLPLAICIAALKARMA